jgi:hypothetical protein
MAVTFVASNHYKAERQRGSIRLKAQLHNVSLTFTNGTDKITLPSSAVTAGFEVGDKIKTNSANSGNQGPFIIKVIDGASNVDLTVMNLDGSAVTLTDGTENNLTIGTYLVKALLMRSGFAFNKDNHATLTNLKAVTGAFTPTFVAATKKITRASGSFITDGFVAGSSITVANSVSNNGVKTIDPAVPVTALEIVVLEALTDETGSGDETLTADDELATGSGYTQSTKLTGVMTVTEDDTLDVGDADFPTITWAASGGSIGPTPSLTLVEEVSGNVIIGNYDFGGESTATDGTPFNCAAGKLRAA